MAKVPATEIQAIFDKIAENDGIPGGYILITEVLTGTELGLQIFVSRGITPWSAAGMLGEAMGIIPVEDIINVDFEGDPFYDDDDEF